MNRHVACLSQVAGEAAGAGCLPDIVHGCCHCNIAGNNILLNKEILFVMLLRSYFAVESERIWLQYVSSAVLLHLVSGLFMPH